MSEEQKRCTLVFRGPIGSGKTTYAKLIIGLLRERGIKVNLGEMSKHDKQLLSYIHKIPTICFPPLEVEIDTTASPKEVTDMNNFEIKAILAKYSDQQITASLLQLYQDQLDLQELDSGSNNPILSAAKEALIDTIPDELLKMSLHFPVRYTTLCQEILFDRKNKR